jgi:hypothetical protein
MANFGDYTKTVYENTTTPAINETHLNNIENKVESIDDELRRSETFKLSDYLNVMYQCNTKEIEAFQKASAWTMDVGGTISNDSTNHLIHSQSVKLLEPDDSAGYLCMWKSCNLDLSIFKNGNASSADDIILLVVYISDITALTEIYLKLGTDNTDNYYKFIAAASLVTGWNFISIAKSDFSENNPPGWDSITYLRCEWYSNANQQNEYVSFQYAQLIREDADNPGYYNPFQLYTGSAWENVFDIGTDYFYLLCYDQKYNKLGIQCLNPDGYVNMIHLPFCDRSNFIFKCKMKCTYAWESQNLTWYVDSDNYIQCSIYANDLRLYWNEAGIDDTDYNTFDDELSFDEGLILELTLEKNESSVRATATINNVSKTLEHITTITDKGCLYFGTADDESFSLIEDCILSHNQGFIFQDEKIKIIKKITPETVNDLDAIQNDNDFVVQLDENGLYEVEIKLAISGAANADFKCAWAVTGGVEQLTSRACLGPDSSTTTTANTNVRCANYDLDTEVTYGTDGSTYSYVLEKFLVKSLATGTLQFQWAQNTAQVSNTIVSANSYLIVRKLT